MSRFVSVRTYEAGVKFSQTGVEDTINVTVDGMACVATRHGPSMVGSNGLPSNEHGKGGAYFSNRGGDFSQLSIHGFYADGHWGPRFNDGCRLQIGWVNSTIDDVDLRDVFVTGAVVASGGTQDAVTSFNVQDNIGRGTRPGTAAWYQLTDRLAVGVYGVDVPDGWEPAIGFEQEPDRIVYVPVGDQLLPWAAR